MDSNHISSGEESPLTATTKKPYEKPSFRCEQVFVTTALSCGKIDPTQLNCMGGQSKVS